MKHIELTPRLRMVADMIPTGAILADVGTDHAYLPAALMLEGKLSGAIAADLRQGPLSRAKETVREYGLNGKIGFRLCDGLSGIRAGEVNAVSIAGMGGETIVMILEAAPWVQNEGIRLILQPMTRAEDLRRWLLHNGFTILEEHLIIDGRHLYPVMAAEYTAAPVCEDELAIYGGFFEAEEGRPYRHMMAEHLLRRVRGYYHDGDFVTVAKLTDLSDLLRRM